MRKRVVALTLAGLAVASCGKSVAKKREEIKTCSATSLDAPGIARCLVAMYRWNERDAAVAGQARQHELDSIAKVERDSAWRVSGAAHKKELAQCTAGGGDIARCLQENYSWDPERAVAVTDSQWRQETSLHRSQMQRCLHQKQSNVGSCLMLYYKWDPKHALAVDDSIARAKVKTMNSR